MADYSTINGTDGAIDVTLYEEYLSPDSFTVQYARDKRTLFRIKGKLVSFNGEKRLVDERGSILFRMVVNIVSKNMHMYLHDLRSNRVYTVRKKNILPGRGRGTLYVVPGKDARADAVLEISSNLWRSCAVITDLLTNCQVGIIRRKLITARKIIAGLDSYTVRVAPDADIAFLAMLTSCYDEHYSEAIQWHSPTPATRAVSIRPVVRVAATFSYVRFDSRVRTLTFLPSPTLSAEAFLARARANEWTIVCVCVCVWLCGWLKTHP